MTLEKLQEAYRARPFRPFVLHLADGRHIRIRHPEWMAISQSGRTIHVEQPDDSSSTIDLLLVTELEVPANGRKTRSA
ncbi:MAG: hypothetical protein NTW87_30615 [Planctomycetota bacterium]|nr:hypothetical protein [Planctomycetota bacterium]